MKSFLIIPSFLSFIFIHPGSEKALAADPPPLSKWTTAFALPQVHELTQNHLLTTLPKMTKEWKVSLEVNPTDYKFTSYANVLHLTIGGKGLGSSANVGDRIPAIWIHKTRGVIISSALNGKTSYTKTFNQRPPAGEWTRIEISQSLQSSSYIYNVIIGTTQLLTIENEKPVDLSDVKVYASSPWYTAQKGFIRNLRVEIEPGDTCASFCLFHV